MLPLLTSLVTLVCSALSMACCARRFGALARDLGEEMTRAERERAIKILDINGDGTIDFAEFLKYWTDMEE